MQQADLTKKVVFCFICLSRVPILPAQLVDLADCRAMLLLEFVQGRQQECAWGEGRHPSQRHLTEWFKTSMKMLH